MLVHTLSTQVRNLRRGWSRRQRVDPGFGGGCYRCQMVGAGRPLRIVTIRELRWILMLLGLLRVCVIGEAGMKVNVEGYQAAR